jgi:hypothetical protein
MCYNNTFLPEQSSHGCRKIRFGGDGEGSDQIRLIIFRIHVYYYYVKAGKERPVAVSEAGNTEVSAIRYRLRDAKTS